MLHDGESGARRACARVISHGLAVAQLGILQKRLGLQCSGFAYWKRFGVLQGMSFRYVTVGRRGI